MYEWFANYTTSIDIFSDPRSSYDCVPALPPWLRIRPHPLFDAVDPRVYHQVFQSPGSKIEAPCMYCKPSNIMYTQRSMYGPNLIGGHMRYLIGAQSPLVGTGSRSVSLCRFDTLAPTAQGQCWPSFTYSHVVRIDGGVARSTS